MVSHINSISGILESSKLIPDVISAVPNRSVKVIYNNGVEVEFGNELTPTKVKEVPVVHFAANESSLYTLLMVDPDAPSRRRPILREFLHWKVVNIPGDDVGKGDTLYQYMGSGPPKDSGLHRYTFLVFEQSGHINIKSESRSGKRNILNRMRFSTKKFAKKHNLGQPVAVNFFEAQYDRHVSKMQKEFTIHILMIVPNFIVRACRSCWSWLSNKF